MNEKQGKLLGLKSCLNKSLQRLQNDDELTQEECAAIIKELEVVKASQNLQKQLWRSRRWA